ncbi:MAG TPA: hypothetical protein VGR92_07530, partial [Steroidobacteraceae bacterium]|nr:hypothetical protein [Steroidobacteraceae bacterium]
DPGSSPTGRTKGIARSATQLLPAAVNCTLTGLPPALTLNFAAALSVDLAMVVAQPGSASQRNGAPRVSPPYVRSKWQLRASGAAVLLAG